MFVRFFFICVLCTSSTALCQLVVTNNTPMDTEEYLVNNILLGDDLATSNFSSVGFDAGIGYFDGFSANIGFDEGILLSSGGLGLVTDAFGGGSGISGDSDLELALNAINLTWGVNNVTILEFDFVAESESVAFNYVFGSVEYTSYTCSIFNDIFGFFLSGPGIEGPYSNDAINLAYVPDPDNPGEYTTTPVAVNTINAGELTNDPDCNDIDPDFESYNIYWIDNDYSGNGWQGVNEPPDPEFTVEGITGFTVPLTAEYNGLICGETYHIKLAIADASDGALNSVVFLEANSFVSPSVVVNPIPNIDGPELFEDPSAIYEGCAAAQLEFEATGNTDYDIVLGITANGTCEYGVDYDISYEDGSPLEECFTDGLNFSIDPNAFVGPGVMTIPCVTIPTGQGSLYVNLEAFYDDENEGFEDLEFIVNAINGICQRAELAVSEINFNVYDQIPIVVEVENPSIIECFGDEVNLQPTEVSGGVNLGQQGGEGYSYEWYDESGELLGSDVSLDITTSADAQYQLVVTDACQNQFVETEFMVEVIEYSDVTMDPLSYNACYGDEVTVIPIINGGSGSYSYIWSDNSSATSFDYTFEFDAGDVQNVDFQIVDDCTANSYDFSVPISLEIQSPVDMTAPPYFACDGDEVVITPDISGGSGSYSYVWPDSPSPCDCESFAFDFELANGTLQNIDFQIIDNCTDLIYEFQVPIELINPLPPTVNIVASGDQFCPGEEITLTAETEGESTYLYEWLNLEADDYYVNNVATIFPNSDMFYEVVVTDECNNSQSTFSITIEVPIYSPPIFTISDAVGCLGQVVELTVENLFSEGVQTDDDFTFLWSPSGDTEKTIEVVVGEDPVAYSVVVTDLCGNASDPLAAEAIVSASVPPPPEFYFEQLGSIVNGQDSIKFFQVGNGLFTDFEWDFGDGNFSTEYEPTHVYDGEGDYYVILTGSDAFGCVNSYNALVNIYPNLYFYSPTVFSPNGDGVNDQFKVSIVGQDEFELFVFDRWGKAIFSTTNPNEGWNGKYPNGEDAPQDVYMYKVLMTNTGVGEKIKKGRVSIIK